MVENLNMQIIENENFIYLNKYYSLHNNMDRRQFRKFYSEEQDFEK